MGAYWTLDGTGCCIRKILGRLGRKWLVPGDPVSRLRRRRLVPEALLAGALAGTVALLFRVALERAEGLRTVFVARMADYAPPYGGITYPLVAGALVALVVGLTRRLAPEAAGSGIPHVKRAMHGMASFRHVRVLLMKFFGAAVGIGAGLALGREGPTIQMGAAVSDALAARLGLIGLNRRLLVSAGAAAGLSAAFNAPLAGIMFVVEELRHDLNEFSLITAITASIVADVLCRAAFGQLPVFHLLIHLAPPLTWLPEFALLGALCGLLGAAFNRSLVFSLEHLSRRPSLLPAFLVGALAGTVAVFIPGLAGTSSPFVTAALNAAVLPGAALAYLLLRFILTVLSYGIGAPGGIFAPLLVIGSLAGAALAGLLATFVDCPPLLSSTFAVVGMGAMFVAIVRAPLTGIILIAEMTSSHELLLPLLVACLTAYFVAESLHSLPIYDALARLSSAGAGRRAAAALPHPTSAEKAQGHGPEHGRQDPSRS